MFGRRFYQTRSWSVYALAMLIMGGALLPGTSNASEQKQILLLLWRAHTETEVAFKECLAAEGIDAVYTEVIGQQDRTFMAKRVRELEADIVAGKFDLIYSYGTTVTQVVKGVVRERKPVVFNIVFDPVGGKLVDTMQHPGHNITGVTNGTPIEEQFDAIQQLAPIKKGLLLVFNAREPNSVIIERQVRNWAEKNNVPFTARRVFPNTSAYKKVLEEIQNDKIVADTLYAGADSYMASIAAEIQAGAGNKLRLFGGTGNFVLKGWLGAYSPTLKSMGCSTAQLAKRVLNGEDAGSIPVVLPKASYVISRSAAALHGVEIPADALLEE